MTARLWPGAICADGYRPTCRDTYVHITAYYGDLEAGTGHATPGTARSFDRHTGWPNGPSRWHVSDSGPLVSPDLADAYPDASPDGDLGLDVPYREVIITGWLKPAELAEFRREWSLEPADAEPALGFLGDLGDGLPRLYPDERHSADGDGWNVGGITPILFATVSIIGPGARPA